VSPKLNDFLSAGGNFATLLLEKKRQHVVISRSNAASIDLADQYSQLSDTSYRKASSFFREQAKRQEEHATGATHMTPPKLYGMDPVTQHAPGNASDNAGPATTSSDYRERRHGPPYAARFSITDTGSKKRQR